MNNIIDTLHHSADLVKGWGSKKLSDGRSLANALTIHGIPLWDMLAPELAIYHVPQALSLGASSPTLGQRVRPYVSWAKHAILNMRNNQRSREDCEEWPSKRTFMFLGFNDYMHRDILQPVITLLEKDNQLAAVSLREGKYAQKTVKVGDFHNPHSIWRHWDKDVKSEVYLLRKKLRHIEKEIVESGELGALISDGDQPLWQQMKPTFHRLFKTYMPNLLIQGAVAKHIAEQHKPVLIVSADGSDPRARAYYAAGRRFGIPIVEIMFGDLVATDAISWKFFMADRLAVSGEKTREIVQSLGVPGGLIAVTGSPRYDRFAVTPDAGKIEASSESGMGDRKAKVLFASTLSLSAYDGLANPDALNIVKKTIFQATDQVNGICLVVKPHPFENVSETKRLAKGCKNIIFVDRHQDIRELTKKCDAFLTLGTQATLGALILNKLVIWPALTGSIWWEHEDFFLGSNAVLVTRSMDELIRTFIMIAECSQDVVLSSLEQARQQFLRQWIYNLDGQAADRIRSLMFEMAYDRGKLDPEIALQQ